MQVIEQKIVIGRLEKIDLPSLSLYGLDAKLDSGAYTSSLHCHKISVFQKEERRWVQFNVLDPDHPEYENRSYESPVHKIKNVKSSNGLLQERVIIKQKAIFIGLETEIQLSLADRSEMKYPVLLGRRFIKGRFIIDVSKKYTSSN